MSTTLHRTPLYPLYEHLGGKSIDFGGWELPVQFSGIQKEHDAVRQQAGLFDVSHMGEFMVSGKGAMDFLQLMTTNDVSKLEVDQAQYSMMCYNDGGVVDDLLVYKLAEERYMLVVNASNIEKDYDWLSRHAEGEVHLDNVSGHTALLALQGPLAAGILGRLTAIDWSRVKPFRFRQDVKVGGIEVPVVSRTGYTGEDGFELYIPSEDAVKLWNILLAEGKEDSLVPVGLGARDTLRFEARLPLYGQELSPTITPVEAGLGMYVKIDKGPFLGREVLAEQKEFGAPRKLVGVEMIDRGIPRSHYPVFSLDNERIGEVTTGTQSPTLKTNVGLALLKKGFAELGTEILIEIRGKLLKAKIVSTPFYRKPKREGENK